MATQSGFQLIYGGGSASEEMEAMEGDSSSSKSSSSDDSMGYAPLVALALISVIGAVAFSLIAVFRGGDQAELLSALLPAVALLLLVIQLLIGFPVKKQLIEATSMMMNIRVKTTPAFYLELLALGIPTLLLANSLIDKYKKEQDVNPNA